MSTEVEIRAPAEQTEGTRSQILRWLKSVGDAVAENEPLIELETDKVTVEVASPGTGTLREILKQEQEEIGPGDLLGRIEAAGSAKAATASGAAHPADATRATPLAARSDGEVTPSNTGASHAAAQSNGEASPWGAGGDRRELDGGPTSSPSGSAAELGAATRSLSPAVRRLLAERGLDVSEVRGTGEGGRVTVADVIGHGGKGGSGTGARSGTANGLDAGASGADLSESDAGTGVANVSGASATAIAAGNFEANAASAAGAGPGPAGPSHRVPHTATRKRIAEHMVQSLLHTAPHVTTVFEADLTAVLEHRQRNKDEFARRGAPLTLTAYFLQATVAAIRAVPEANSRWTDSALEIFESLHIGVATALETGLVVPVLRDVQSRDLFETAKGLEDLVSRAREGRLAPTDMRGGTFTISNHGVSGSLVATPIIINQPQAAILGIGKLEKRPVVSSDDAGEDRIVIRPRCYVTLTIDHRVMDGHQANRFLQTFVGRLATSDGTPGPSAAYWAGIPPNRL
jgi:2-oxoglutarate dehydrogenase E2 component (dihydrolipoamide succinyltransferase)